MNRSDTQNYNYASVRGFLASIGAKFSESEEQFCKRLDVTMGKEKTIVKVFSTGKIQIQGPANALQKKLITKRSELEKFVATYVS